MMQKRKHYDFFISGRWRNKTAILDLTHKIREKGYSVYCFLETAGNMGQDDDSEDKMHAFEALDWKKNAYIHSVFEKDIEAEKESDAFILLLPAGKSCHIEAGVAYGLGKKCILIGEQKEAESLYLIFHENYPTIHDFLQSL